MARGQRGRPARPSVLCSLASKFTSGLDQAAAPCPLQKSPQGSQRRGAHLVVAYLQERGMAKGLMCVSRWFSREVSQQ